MSSFKNLVKSCVELQHKFNLKVNPNYLKELTPVHWTLAIHQEVSEAIDSLNWKWWKDVNKPIDVDNLKIETVDILHFVISFYLSLAEGNIEEVTNAIAKIKEVQAEPVDAITLAYLNSVLMSVTCTFFSDPESIPPEEALATIAGTPLQILKSLMETCNLQEDELFKLYILKNALNKLRQDYGYKEGKYQKIWGGMEDNRYLLKLLEKDVDDIDDAYKMLKDVYESVAKQQ